jgi:hypothetical protein
MAERRAFETGNDSFDIIKHPDGSLSIEAAADYGDSYTGWGSTTATLWLEPAQVVALQKFLLDQ